MGLGSMFSIGRGLRMPHKYMAFISDNPAFLNSGKTVSRSNFPVSAKIQCKTSFLSAMWGFVVT